MQENVAPGEMFVISHNMNSFAANNNNTMMYCIHSNIWYMISS